MASILTDAPASAYSLLPRSGHGCEEAAMQRVGVIGLGKMGLPIARNLMERGFEVIGHRRSGSPELIEAGGQAADSPAEVARRSDVLLSIVPDAAAVTDVVCGEAGTLAGLRPGAVHIEMSTIDIARKARIRDGFMTWQLSTYERDGTTGLAVLREDGSLAGPTERKRWATLMELVADWEQAVGVLRGLDVADAPLVEYDRLLAPLWWPRKVMCAGVNYR